MACGTIGSACSQVVGARWYALKLHVRNRSLQASCAFACPWGKKHTSLTCARCACLPAPLLYFSFVSFRARRLRFVAYAARVMCVYSPLHVCVWRARVPRLACACLLLRMLFIHIYSWRPFVFSFAGTCVRRRSSAHEVQETTCVHRVAWHFQKQERELPKAMR